MSGNEIVCRIEIIGIDVNSNDLFGRDEQDEQDAKSRRNPVYPVSKSSQKIV